MDDNGLFDINFYRFFETIGWKGNETPREYLGHGPNEWLSNESVKTWFCLSFSLCFLGEHSSSYVYIPFCSHMSMSSHPGQRASYDLPKLLTRVSTTCVSWRPWNKGGSLQFMKYVYIHETRYALSCDHNLSDREKNKKTFNTSVMRISIPPLDLSSRSFIPLSRFICSRHPTPLLAPSLVLSPPRSA